MPSIAINFAVEFDHCLEDMFSYDPITRVVSIDKTQPIYKFMFDKIGSALRESKEGVTVLLTPFTCRQTAYTELTSSYDHKTGRVHLSSIHGFYLLATNLQDDFFSKNVDVQLNRLWLQDWMDDKPAGCYLDEYASHLSSHSLLALTRTIYQQNLLSDLFDETIKPILFLIHINIFATLYEKYSKKYFYVLDTTKVLDMFLRDSEAVPENINYNILYYRRKSTTHISLIALAEEETIGEGDSVLQNIGNIIFYLKQYKASCLSRNEQNEILAQGFKNDLSRPQKEAIYFANGIVSFKVISLKEVGKIFGIHFRRNSLSHIIIGLPVFHETINYLSVSDTQTNYFYECAAPKVLSKKTRKQATLYFALDFDRCFSLPFIIQSSTKQVCCKIDHPFFQKILQLINEAAEKYQSVNVVISSASNRQTPRVELKGNDQNETIVSFYAFYMIAMTLQSYYADNRKINVIFNRFLLHDWLTHQKPGWTMNTYLDYLIKDKLFDMQHVYKSDPFFARKNAVFFGETKLILMLLLINIVSHEFSDTDNYVYFFDDMLEIIQTTSRFFKNHPQALPYNVHYQNFWCNPKEVKVFQKPLLKGVGPCYYSKLSYVIHSLEKEEEKLQRFGSDSKIDFFKEEYQLLQQLFHHMQTYPMQDLYHPLPSISLAFIDPSKLPVHGNDHSQAWWPCKVENGWFLPKIPYVAGKYTGKIPIFKLPEMHHYVPA